jgi:hypothetical protein
MSRSKPMTVTICCLLTQFSLPTLIPAAQVYGLQLLPALFGRLAAAGSPPAQDLAAIESEVHAAVGFVCGVFHQLALYQAAVAAAQQAQEGGEAGSGGGTSPSPGPTPLPQPPLWLAEDLTHEPTVDGCTAGPCCVLNHEPLTAGVWALRLAGCMVFISLQVVPCALHLHLLLPGYHVWSYAAGLMDALVWCCFPDGHAAGLGAAAAALLRMCTATSDASTASARGINSLDAAGMCRLAREHPCGTAHQALTKPHEIWAFQSTGSAASQT